MRRRKRSHQFCFLTNVFYIYVCIVNCSSNYNESRDNKKNDGIFLLVSQWNKSHPSALLLFIRKRRVKRENFLQGEQKLPNSTIEIMTIFIVWLHIFIWKLLLCRIILCNQGRKSAYISIMLINRLMIFHLCSKSDKTTTMSDRLNYS